MGYLGIDLGTTNSIAIIYNDKNDALDIVKVDGTDEILPEGLAENFIWVERAKHTVLQAFKVIREKLNKHQLDIYDACFFLNRAGDMLCAEVSPDQMGTLCYIGDNPQYREIFTDRSKDATYAKWKLTAELLGVVV